MNGMTRGAD